MIRTVAAVKRPYRTTIRRGDAPALICAAAHRLFAEKGYLATSIDDIAAAAGVARPTIFTAVGPKAAILRLVVDQALAGDDEPVPIAQRPWWREAIDEPDPVRSIRLHARNMCLINHRAAPVLRALETAASFDAEAAEVWTRFQRQRHDGLREVAATLSRKTTRLRYDEPTITDILAMLAADAYVRLVRDAGWTPERFQDWLTDTLLRLLLD
jgi:AcrR family transcriptional regulator